MSIAIYRYPDGKEMAEWKLHYPDHEVREGEIRRFLRVVELPPGDYFCILSVINVSVEAVLEIRRDYWWD